MSKTETTCLETIVFKLNNKLRTIVYVKPTNRQSYLHSKSEHPNLTKKVVPIARH